MRPSLSSGIVVIGLLTISVLVLILSIVGWYVYRNRILSYTPTGNGPVKKIEGTVDRRLKPDLITCNYKSDDQTDHEEEGSNCDETRGVQCGVCLRGLENEQLVRQLPKCKHTFHAPCIDTWLHSHYGCPLCRTLIDRLPSEDDVALATPPDQEKNSQEVTPVDNIRMSMLSPSII
ncbi:unnamed protein product [Prunus brigantina]